MSLHAIVPVSEKVINSCKDETKVGRCQLYEASCLHAMHAIVPVSEKVINSCKDETKVGRCRLYEASCLCTP